MITPAFSLTATERVLPKLALDFTTASLDSRITFTRTTGVSNPATYVNSIGIITAATNNQPRFDYNPVTLACKGLLIEESRANLMLYSEDITNWTNSNSSDSSNVATAPDGSSTADKIITNAAAVNGQIYRNVAKAASVTTYTYSTFAKKAEWDRIGLYLSDAANFSNRADFVVSLTNGSVVSAATARGTFTAASGNVVEFLNGWYRVSLTFTSSTETAILYRNYSLDSVSATGDGTSGIYWWGAQLEAGAFATSYIPTTITALTRNADVATMTGTNFSDWFNASEGAFSIDCVINTKPAAQILMEISDGTSANRIQYQRDSNSNVLSYVSIVSSSITVNLQKASTFVNDAASITAAYKLDNYGVAVNGGVTTTDTSSGVPTVDRMRIGATVAGTAPSSGWYQKLFYYPQRLTNAEVQAFSK